MRSFILITCLLLIVTIGAFFYWNWLEVAPIEGTNGKQGVSVTFDKEKASSDVAAAKEKVKEQAKAAKEMITGKEEIKGTLKAVNVEQKQVTIARPDTADMTVQITAESKLRLGDKDATLEELRPGQEVTCIHDKKDDKLVCVALTVKPEAMTTAAGVLAGEAVEVEGVVKAVDQASKFVTLTVAGKPDVTVAVTPGTQLTLDGKAAQLSEIQPGQQATCTHLVQAGKNVCRELRVQSK